MKVIIYTIIILNMFIRRLANKLFKVNLFKFEKLKLFTRSYSSPALIQNHNSFNIVIEGELDWENSYVCPLCKDTGVVPCIFCEKGCIICGYSKFVLCRCQYDV